jgi:hypothetical protein
MEIRPLDLRGYWPLWGVGFPEPDFSPFLQAGTQTGSVPAASAFGAPVCPMGY